MAKAEKATTTASCSALLKGLHSEARVLAVELHSAEDEVQTQADPDWRVRVLAAAAARASGLAQAAARAAEQAQAEAQAAAEARAQAAAQAEAQVRAAQAAALASE